MGSNEQLTTIKKLYSNFISKTMTKHRKTQPLRAIVAAMATVPLLIACPSGGDSPKNNSITNPPTPTTEIPTNNLPQQPFPVPGWLAVGTKPQKEGRSDYPFSPTNPDAEIAIFSDEWSGVPSGTTLMALTPGGLKEEVKFRRSGQEPYGCDDLPTPMATFTAAQAMPEGGFWLLPAAKADRAKAIRLVELPLSRLPSNLLPPEKRQATAARAWQGGNLIILLAKQTDKKAKLSITNNSVEIFSSSVEVLGLEGSYDEPLDLSTRYQPGIPQAIGVFQFDSSSQQAIVLWYPSFEGHHFQVVAPKEGKMELFKAGYVYSCAF